MIAQMFHHLLDHPGSLPEEYREYTVDVPVPRAVCDYIAGMTDGFFHRTYQQLFA